ncbi:MAG: DNA methyltransferase [Melioribacteraceae bacterium]|nr:DNA methyltransferase [Melioribacteraceae bacterium]
MTDLLKKLKKAEAAENIADLRLLISKISDELTSQNEQLIEFYISGQKIVIKTSSLQKDLQQIIDSKTIERAKYYLKRLINSLTEFKFSGINDINLNRWRDYDDILTDSLWIFNKRDSSGKHTAQYWGNFIPQIPNQLLRRYTKKSEWVLDPFLGSGTTMLEAQRLERNCVGIDLQKKAADVARKLVKEERVEFNVPENVKSKILVGDSTNPAFVNKIKSSITDKVQFIMMHPPYWDIIKFSGDKNDLSNASSEEAFLSMFEKVLDNSLDLLEPERYFAVVIGDKYSKGDWIPLGFDLMNMIKAKGHKLKSIVVKNFEDTTAKRNTKDLWRYRAIAGGFYIFKHEYIFIFQKSKRKK